MQPKVSIQIPTYNQAGVVGHAIESCLAQDYANLEINVADDCSTDNTAEVVSRYLHDPRVKYYRNDPNTGRVKNYQRALYMHATGDWAINLDGDDFFCDTQFISRGMEIITNEGIDEVLFYMASQVNELSERPQPAAPEVLKKMTAKQYFETFHSERHFFHLTTIYSRKAVQGKDFYSEDIISSDILSFLKLCITYPAKKVILSNAIVGVWVKHGQNESSSLSFKKAWKNTRPYKYLYKMYVEKFGWNAAIAGWWLKGQYLYWRSYIYRALKQLAGK